MRARRWAVVVGVALVVVLAGCGDDEDPEAAAPTTATTETTSLDEPTTTAAPDTEPLRILVTNDDGVGAPGIDALVEALRQEDGVEVTVVAPAENQSGSASSTTDGPLTTSEATTASGYDAVAVAGFPADTIVWALDQGGTDVAPDLVISGINEGQNVGPFTELSGTVGAARAAAQRGLPAVAASQGIGAEPDFAAGAQVVLDWLAENRDQIVAGTYAAGDVVNLNIPTCTDGEVRGVVEVPTATDLAGRDPFVSVCSSTASDPADDVDAITNGFAAESVVAATPAGP